VVSLTIYRIIARLSKPVLWVATA